MNAIARLIRSEPAAVAEVVRNIVLVLVGFSIVHWTDAQVALVLALVGSVLAAAVRALVVPASHAADAVDAAAAAGRNEALAAVSALAPEPPAGRVAPRPRSAP